MSDPVQAVATELARAVARDIAPTERPAVVEAVYAIARDDRAAARLGAIFCVALEVELRSGSAARQANVETIFPTIKPEKERP